MFLRRLERDRYTAIAVQNPLTSLGAADNRDGMGEKGVRPLFPAWIKFEIRSTAAGHWEASGSRMRLSGHWLARRVRPSEVGPHAQHHP